MSIRHPFMLYLFPHYFKTKPNLIKLLDKNLEYIEHEFIEDTIYISRKFIKEYVCCPYCCTLSNKVHSRYKISF